MSGPSATDEEDQLVVVFKEPIPLCRGPKSRPDGRFVLDFPDEDARAAFKQRCTQTVASNCQQGARDSCSLAAMDKCRGPSWLRWLGWKPRKSWSEIEACEEERMQACLVSSGEACQQHAEEFCALMTKPPR